MRRSRRSQKSVSRGAATIRHVNRILKKTATDRLSLKVDTSRRDTAAGFTLLEVMAAFVIAAFGSILLYQAGFEGSASAAAAARLQEAVVRAQSRLASVGVLTPLQPEQLSGDDGGGYHWRLNIMPDQSSGPLALFLVQVTEQYGSRQVTLATERLSGGQ